MSDSGPLAAIRSALVATVGRDVAVAVWGIDVAETRHDPIEEARVANAVEKRRVEFRRGRACARAALAALGGPTPSIEVGPHREPIWPEGFVGAITHCGAVVAAAVAPRHACAGLGIDIELAAPLDPGAEELALTSSEIERLPAPWHASLVFSAKESVFKTVFPISRQWLGFDEVELDVRPDGPGAGVDGYGSGTFSATLLGGAESYRVDVAALVGSVIGTWRCASGHVVTTGRLPVAAEGAVA